MLYKTMTDPQWTRDEPSVSSCPEDNGIDIRDLNKVYRLGRRLLTVLDGVDLLRPRGSFTALLGPSGCGKTTILRLLADLDHPTTGTILINS
jgi:NitT/TauT family transport system ATP-binding protein